MSFVRVSVIGLDGQTIMSCSGENGVSLIYDSEYIGGEVIRIECKAPEQCCVIQLEDTMAPAMVYIPGGILEYVIPAEPSRQNLSPRSFVGAKHLIRARIATTQDIAEFRNLAFNPYDSHTSKGFYPHAFANVETRNEVVFAASNAIDGMLENTNHGAWPFQSWGINRDPEACLTIDFGRAVLVEELRVTLRADFPHDSWWTMATVSFSDGSSETLKLQKSAKTQSFSVKPRKVEWLRFEKLIKAQDESPFPALTELEVWGYSRISKEQ